MQDIYKCEKIAWQTWKNLDTNSRWVSLMNSLTFDTHSRFAFFRCTSTGGIWGGIFVCCRWCRACNDSFRRWCRRLNVFLYFGYCCVCRIACIWCRVLNQHHRIGVLADLGNSYESVDGARLWLLCCRDEISGWHVEMSWWDPLKVCLHSVIRNERQKFIYSVFLQTEGRTFFSYTLFSSLFSHFSNCQIPSHSQFKKIWQF